MMIVSRIAAACLAVLMLGPPASAQDAPLLRLYVLDNGEINGLAPALFNFSEEEVEADGFIVTSYLVVHPDGVLLWEAGAVPDAELPTDGSLYQEGPTTVRKSLRGQLQEAGYGVEDVDWFAMSHLHSDHTGNANLFAGARWIVQQADREMMFSGNEVRVMNAALFSALREADTLLLHDEDHDVFGDGTVRILSAPGHTPGHQVLLVDLADYGPVLLAGDLYHYPEEISTGRTPTFEYDTATTAVSREKIQRMLEETGAELWIGHDKATHARLRFAPQYYE